jgi:hypothetical protein
MPFMECRLWSATTVLLRAATLAYHQAGVLSARFNQMGGSDF